MWHERSVHRVLETQQQCTLAVFGVGAFDAAVPSHVYTNNYLTEEDLRSLRADGAVGDVCTVFLRADGTYRDIAMNARCSGPDPSQLARIPVACCSPPAPARRFRCGPLSGRGSPPIW